MNRNNQVNSMVGKALNLLRKLRKNTSGNAVLLVALGIPVLIGGSGYAVDTAQWYLWKRELQYAVDQAAIAGAWARTKDDTEDSYQTRADQEFTANLSVTDTFASTPVISLEDFAGGTDNSVVVTASATKSLPFSSFITGDAATISVFAQASFEQGATFTSCMIAIDDHADGAVTLGGSSLFTAACGIAALSDSSEAIRVNGNPTVEAGWLLATGEIDDWFDTNTNDLILENQDNLVDPFEGLTPPNPPSSQTPRTFSCPTGTTSTTADVTERYQRSYSYTRGPSENNASAYNNPNGQASTDVTTGPTNQSVPNGTTPGTTVTGPTTTSNGRVGGSSNQKIFEYVTTTRTVTYANVQTNTSQTQSSLQPGTYSDMTITCDTVFAPGIYVIDGGNFVTHAQHTVTGSGVMFVLKNGAGIRINGGASINLTAMTVSELVAQGVSQEDAEKLAGMLIFEDPNSSGNTRNKVNGNASTVLNGAIYLPNSNLDFSGTAAVTSQCLMLAAKTIELTGNVSMTSFCPANMTNTSEVSTSPPRVRLVS